YPVVLALFLTRRRLVLFLLVSCLPITAWMVRNYRATGHFTFSSIQEANLFIVRAALVEMDRQHISYETAVAEVQKAYEDSHAPSPGRWAVRYLLAHVKDYSRLMAKDVVKLLSGNSMKVAAWALLKDDYYAPTAVPVHSTLSPMEQARELMKRHPAL